MCYKVYAKALEKCLQSILMEIIDFDQSAFFPLRFIMDNILLTKQSIAWPKSLVENMVFCDAIQNDKKCHVT